MYFNPVKYAVMYPRQCHTHGVACTCYVTLDIALNGRNLYCSVVGVSNSIVVLYIRDFSCV